MRIHFVQISEKYFTWRREYWNSVVYVCENRNSTGYLICDTSSGVTVAATEKQKRIAPVIWQITCGFDISKHGGLHMFHAYSFIQETLQICADEGNVCY